MKLHLCCGNDYRAGWHNVDFYAHSADEKLDLSVFPWPYPDNTVDEIYIQWALEHFDRPEDLIREMHRVLKPGGLVRILVPHKDSLVACAPDHRYFFTRLFFGIFCDANNYYIRQHKCLFIEEEYRVKLLYGHWTPFDFIASKYPVIWEKFSFSFFRPSTIEWAARKAIMPMDS
ncbi:MAG: methyltransferase domain-containing protein [Kiritimatiellaeota bacterium]|nr:methyltransferase domain-containing protein [Kiritimatiellota bacterium]